MVATCASAIKGRVVRVISLDACGNPVTGASSAVVVSEGFISVKSTPQYEDGTEYTQKNAAGALCVNEMSNSQFKRVELEAVFCVLDPDIATIIGGGRLLESGSATGVGAAFGETVNTNRFSLEVWQNVSGRNACDAAGNPQYVYWTWANAGDGKVGDYTVEDGVSQFKLTAITQAVGPLWLTGPGTDGPWLPEALVSGEHYAWAITSTAPPTASCGAVLLS